MADNYIYSKGQMMTDYTGVKFTNMSGELCQLIGTKGNLTDQYIGVNYGRRTKKRFEFSIPHSTFESMVEEKNYKIVVDSKTPTKQVEEKQEVIVI